MNITTGANSTYTIGNYLNIYESYMIRNNIVPYNDKEEYIRFLTRFILHHGYLRGTLKKVSAFFTKKAIITTTNEEVKRQIRDIFEELDYLTLQFNTIFNMFIFDYAAVIYLPKQILSVKCPNCSTDYKINEKYTYSFRLNYLDDMYHIEGGLKRDYKLPEEERKLYAKAIGIQSTCTNCGSVHISEPKVEWDFKAKGKLKLLNPLWCDVYSNDAGNKYLRINPEFYDGALELDLDLRYYHIEGLTWDLINCFAAKDRYFVPNTDYYELFHMEEFSSLGSGRSVSSIISSVSDLLHIDIMKLGNEGIALSKVNPLYMLTPTDPSGNGAFGLVDQEQFKDFMLQEVKEYQQGDINRMIYSPIPVNAIPLFGDGKRFLALQELMHMQSSVVTSFGYSPDVLNGTTGIINEPFNLSSMEMLLEGFQTNFSRLLNNVLRKKIPSYNKEKEETADRKLFIMEKISLAKGGLDYNTKISLVQQGVLPVSVLIEDMGYPSIKHWESVMAEESISKYRSDMKLNQTMGKIEQNMMMAAADQQASTGQIDIAAAQYQMEQEAEYHLEQLANIQDAGQRRSYFEQLQNENQILYYIVIGKWREYKQFSKTQNQYADDNATVI